MLFFINKINDILFCNTRDKNMLLTINDLKNKTRLNKCLMP